MLPIKGSGLDPSNAESSRLSHGTGAVGATVKK
jgi:hypothetical protein